MSILSLTISEQHMGKSLLAILKGELGLSTTCINRLKRTETGLTVNGKRVFTNARPQPGDLLLVDLSSIEGSNPLLPVPMELDIPYEDEHLLILNKSAPLAVIPSSLVPEEPTLANGLAHHLGPGVAFHPVNRLDRGTTGLMIVAKSGYIHDRLRRALHSRAFFRRYLAVCTGCPSPTEGSIDLPIGRAPDSAVKRQVDPAGQSAQSLYRVLESRGSFSLVELTPLTGRTHQLRVHMAAIGHPLAGDWLYGTEDRSLIPRPALHAHELTVEHPITKENLHLTAALPVDMLKVLER